MVQVHVPVQCCDNAVQCLIGVLLCKDAGGACLKFLFPHSLCNASAVFPQLFLHPFLLLCSLNNTT